MQSAKIDGKWSRDPVPAPYYVATTGKAWCYVCDEQHRWIDPCSGLKKLSWVRKEFNGKR